MVAGVLEEHASSVVRIAVSSRLLVTTYKLKECHNSEDHNPIFHHCEVLRSYTCIFCFICVRGLFK